MVKRELICVNEEVKSDMWERKKGPLRRGKAQRMRSTKIEKGCKKGRIELTTLGFGKEGSQY